MGEICFLPRAIDLKLTYAFKNKKAYIKDGYVYKREDNNIERRVGITIVKAMEIYEKGDLNAELDSLSIVIVKND